MNRSVYYKAALTADALSLGSHWVTDQDQLASLYPDGVVELTSPASLYHPLRSAGDLTPSGDEMVWLRNAIHQNGSFNFACWRKEWLAGMADYDGHFSGATLLTLENDALWPSPSDDLAGAARIAPLLDLGLGEEETIQAARQQTALTHGDPKVADAAEFFVRAVFAIRFGLDIPQALFNAASAKSYQLLDAPTALAAALTGHPEDIRKTSEELGTASCVLQSFTFALYLAERPDSSFRSMITENALAGGDTAARAMLLSLLFAARDGESILDQDLLDGISTGIDEVAAAAAAAMNLDHGEEFARSA